MRREPKSVSETYTQKTFNMVHGPIACAFEFRKCKGGKTYLAPSRFREG